MSNPSLDCPVFFPPIFDPHSYTFMLIHLFPKHSLIFLLCLFYYFPSIGQTKEKPVVTFLDYQKKPTKAPGFSYIELMWQEGDLWHAQWYWNPEKKLMCDFFYADSSRQKRHGRYLEFRTDGTLKDSGYYVNGACHGNYFSWHQDGGEARVFHYNNGVPVDTCISWNEDGGVSYVSITDSAGNGMAQSYHRNGSILEKGRLHQGGRSGEWVVYDSIQTKIMQVKFESDSLVSAVCFDQAGNLAGGQCIYEKPASFPGGRNGWRKFLESRMQYPPQALAMNITGVVKVKFQVSKTGELSEFEIVSSPHESLSNEVLRLMKSSPRWEPAIQYNRPVIYRHIQSITFNMN
jgi:TonB family protein